MGPRTIYPGRRAGVLDRVRHRLRRLAWRGLWLVANYCIDLSLAGPTRLDFDRSQAGHTVSNSAAKQLHAPTRLVVPREAAPS
jgi:hypothetical protein